MILNKHQMTTGLAEYIAHEIIPNVPDKLIRIELSMLIYGLQNNTSIADNLLNIPAVKMFMQEDENGNYSVDMAFEAVREALSQHGQLTMELPSNSLFSKEKKTLSFSPSDIDKLRGYMERVNVA